MQRPRECRNEELDMDTRATARRTGAAAFAAVACGRAAPARGRDAAGLVSDFGDARVT